jgi:transcription elongation factor GreA
MGETLSKEAYERLKQEYEELTTKGRIEVAKAIEAARALGDLSENGDYHAAKDAKAKMEARIRQLEEKLSKAEIVERKSGLETAETGCCVELLFEGDENPELYLIGSIEEKTEGVQILSPSSALGKAVIGRKSGDWITYETPTGAQLKAQIVSIK